MKFLAFFAVIAAIVTVTYGAYKPPVTGNLFGDLAENVGKGANHVSEDFKSHNLTNVERDVVKTFNYGFQSFFGDLKKLF